MRDPIKGLLLEVLLKKEDYSEERKSCYEKICVRGIGETRLFSTEAKWREPRKRFTVKGIREKIRLL